MNARPRLPEGTVTFLSTDIEGSTGLARALGLRWDAVLADHERLLRSAIEGAGGVVVRIEGDAFFAAFATPTPAVAAAVEAQRSLADHPWPPEGPIRVRMGIHTGEGRLGGDDYVGLEVHRAARVAAAGHGGQILISSASLGLMREALPKGVHVRDLGRHRLKDFPEPEGIAQLVVEGLRADFPPLRTLEVPTNLPVPRTSFVGRDREVGQLADLVRSTGLVTLTGPGGTGKTRLALRVAQELLPDFRDGVFFVDLSPIEDPALVPSTVAQALRLSEDPGRSAIEVVKDFLAGRQTLLVLDNFEQVVGAASAVDEMMGAAPDISALVTSRLRLDLPGEHDFHVSPLDPPDPAVSDPGLLSENDAVRLFADRAQAARSDFALGEDNIEIVAEICARLEGLPLAIELAAAQIRILSPREIGSRLHTRLGSLGTGPRTVPERQRTLRGTLAWSHDLLPPNARVLFARLSTFAGGAPVEAVEPVCNARRDVGGDALETLTTLVDHSFVRRLDTARGSVCTMLETVREFGLERLEESGEAPHIRELHASFYTDVAEAAEPHLTGTDRDPWLDRLDRDHANLRAALQWSVECDRGDVGLRLVAALWRFWQVRGHVREGRRIADTVLALPSSLAPTRAHARALLALGSLAYWQGDATGARAPYEEGLRQARTLGDRDVIGDALFNLGYVEAIDGRFEAAERLFQEAGQIRDALQDRRGRAWVDVGMAMLLQMQERWDEIGGVLEDAVVTFRDVGDQFGIENAVGTIAAAEYRLGNFARAEELMRDTLGGTVTPTSSAMVAIGGMASLALARGNPIRALRLWGAFEELLEQVWGDAHPPWALLPLRDTREEAAAQVDEQTATAARDEGRRMSYEEAVRYALEKT